MTASWQIPVESCAPCPPIVPVQQVFEKLLVFPLSRRQGLPVSVLVTCGPLSAGARLIDSQGDLHEFTTAGLMCFCGATEAERAETLHQSTHILRNGVLIGLTVTQTPVIEQRMKSGRM
jgi:hypothetical protein